VTTRTPADLARDVPGSTAARAAAVIAGETAPAPVRDAATVLLLRDRPDGRGPEVHLQRRVASMAFAAGMTVFPGGGVDPRDADPGSSGDWTGPEPAWWGEHLADGDEALGRALVCAAVRETFEECGVLLAGPGPDTVVADVDDDAWEADRQALLAREVALAPLLARRGLVLRADLLRPWARWTTPEVEPRRYDTRFFVAALPAGQRSRHVGGESDRSGWSRPADALEAWAAGEVGMLPPTVAALRALLPHPDVASVLAAPVGVQPVLPRLVPRPDGGVDFLLPGDPGYDEAAPGAGRGRP